MLEKNRQIIHRMDQRTDLLRDELLLKMAAGIRDGLMDMPDEQTEGLTDMEWEKLCEKLISRSAEELPLGEKIRMFLMLTGNCAVFFDPGEKTESPEVLLAACKAQRNRIRFFRMMKPLRNEMIQRLPEDERCEAESISRAQERMMDESMNAYLSLYRITSTDRQSRHRNDLLRRLERHCIPVGERQEDEKIRAQIDAFQEVLEETEKHFQIFLNSRRRMNETEGYEIYRTEERGNEDNDDQRNSAETEEHGNPEGTSETDASQLPSPQHGKQREKNVDVRAIFATESD